MIIVATQLGFLFVSLYLLLFLQSRKKDVFFGCCEGFIRAGFVSIVVARLGNMACIPIPVCIECGSPDNPCRCKIVGPTLGFVAFCLAALVEWPVGAVVWCCDRKAGRRIMEQPAMRVRPAVSSAIPF